MDKLKSKGKKNKVFGIFLATKGISAKLSGKKKGAICLILFLFLFSTYFTLSSSPNVGAQTTGEKLNDIKQKIADYQKVIAEKQSQIQSLQNEIAILDATVEQIRLQITQTQLQIDQTNADIAATEAEIALKEKEIRQKKKVLGELIKVLYRDSKSNVLELITTADNLSELLDRMEYNSIFQKKIADILGDVKNLKAELEEKKLALEQKKVELGNLLAQKKQEETELNQSIVAKQQILDQTQGEEDVFRKILSDLYLERASLTKKYNEQYGSGATAYPWGNPAAVDGSGNPIWFSDPWGFYVGECTSYVAWKRSTIGKPFRNTRPGAGSAYNWPNLARDQGYQVGGEPKVGAIMVFPRPLFPGDLWGHVAYVEAVNPNGTVEISEYNWAAKHTYSYRKNVVPSNYSAVFVY